MDKIKKNYLLILVIFNILYISIGSFLASLEVINRFSLAVGMIFILLPINMIVGFFTRKKYKTKIIDYFMLLILLFGIIATIFAYKVDVSLLGEEGRYEGIMMIAYYLSVLYISSFIKKEDKKKIVYVILVTGILQLLFALCQKFNLLGVKTYHDHGEYLALGFNINPNFLATNMLICLCLSIGLFIDSIKNKLRIIYYVLIIIFTIGIIITDTLSVVVGLFFVIIYAIIYAFKCKKKALVLFVIIGIIGISTLFQLLSFTKIGNDIVEFKSQTTDLASGNTNNIAYYGSGRIYVWGETLKIIPRYLIKGVGIDNFKYVLNGNPIFKWGKGYDKAHNEYLQLLVTGGIWYLLSFLSLYFSITINGIKSSFKNKELYIILPIIGYLVQAFFNISVIEVAPIFFIILGLAVERKRKTS